jgi:Leucine-rich repeat (LRR) protein
MKKLGYLLLPAWIAFSGLLTSCSDTNSPVVDMIKIEGVSWACNVNTSYAIFGSSSETEELLEVTLPASAGDLLYMIKDDLQFYYRYSPEDDTLLSVTFDTLNAVSVYLNGNLEYMELSESSSLEAFSQLSDPEIAQLSTIFIQGPITDDHLRLLKKYETVLSGIGLVVEGGAGSESFYEILSLCQPTFLVIDELGVLPEPADGSCVSKLELLWVDGNIPALTKLSNCCSNMESLIVASWEPEPGELLPLAGLKKLQSLTIAESDITTLSSIEFPESLRKLHLVSCDTLSDISSLGELQNLKHLSLTECARTQDLEVLLELESLQWLSFPPNISQQELGKLTEGLTQLKVVELIDCSEIKDLSPLQALPELSILVLHLEKEQLGMLASLEQLQLLILSNEVFEDNPEWIKELRVSLPNTTIVPGSGLCLGSGWLLLLLPFILIFRHFFRHKV